MPDNFLLPDSVIFGLANVVSGSNDTHQAPVPYLDRVKITAINTGVTPNTVDVKFGNTTVAGCKYIGLPTVGNYATALISGADLIVLCQDLGSSSITSGFLGPGSVTSTILADLAVLDTKLADNSVIQIKLHDTIVSTAKMVDSAITDVKVATSAITTIKLNDSSVTTNKVVDGTLTGTDVAATTIAAGNIVSHTVTATQITGDTITAAEIAANAITTSELASNSVVTGKIVANTILASNVAADTLTANEIAANAITASEINAGAVTTAKIFAGAITATEIAAGAIVAGKISAGAIDGITITGSLIQTASSGQRVAIYSVGANEISFYSGNGSETDRGYIIAGGTYLAIKSPSISGGFSDLFMDQTSGSLTTASIVAFSWNNSYGSGIFTPTLTFGTSAYVGHVAVTTNSGGSPDTNWGLFVTSPNGGTDVACYLTYYGDTANGRYIGGYNARTGAAVFYADTNQTFFSPSSQHIKKNIKTLRASGVASSTVSIESSLTKINALNPVRFQQVWNTKNDLGLIAEEVAKVIPEATNVGQVSFQGFDKDGKLNHPIVPGVSYNAIVATLVHAVQELSDKLDAQEAIIDSLKKGKP